MSLLAKAAMGLAVAATLTACATSTGAPVASAEQEQVMQANGTFLETDLGRLFVKDTGGAGPTIVLWPSVFTDHRIYDDLVQTLSGRYRFVLIDGPGHGRSEGPVTTFPMRRAADAMAAVLDHYGIERAVVGGTSWGGLTGADLALRQPERVEALILMNTPMEIDARRPGASAHFIALGARLGPGAAVFRNGVARSFFSADVLQANPDYAAAFHAMLQAADRRQLSAAVRSVILKGSPLKDRMSEISVPTLVIAGAADALYPVETQRNAAALLPDGVFEVVEGKHISVVERPEAVAQLIDNFVQKSVPQR
jgi:pimeloyl-ACP methyl ester carboxylesterase